MASGMEDVAAPTPLDQLDGRLARLGDGVRFRRKLVIGRHPALLHEVRPVHGVGGRGIDGDVGAPQLAAPQGFRRVIYLIKINILYRHDVRSKNDMAGQLVSTD